MNFADIPSFVDRRCKARPVLTDRILLSFDPKNTWVYVTAYAPTTDGLAIVGVQVATFRCCYDELRHNDSFVCDWPLPSMQDPDVWAMPIRRLPDGIRSVNCLLLRDDFGCWIYGDRNDIRSPERRLTDSRCTAELDFLYYPERFFSEWEKASPTWFDVLHTGKRSWSRYEIFHQERQEAKRKQEEEEIAASRKWHDDAILGLKLKEENRLLREAISKLKTANKKRFTAKTTRIPTSVRMMATASVLNETNTYS